MSSAIETFVERTVESFESFCDEQQLTAFQGTNLGQRLADELQASAEWRATEPHVRALDEPSGKAADA